MQICGKDAAVRCLSAQERVRKEASAFMELKARSDFDWDKPAKDVKWIDLIAGCVASDKELAPGHTDKAFAYLHGRGGKSDAGNAEVLLCCFPPSSETTH